VSDFERDFDVIVAGGGVAGIAAALQCARDGIRTVLVEKTILPGGLATSGLVNVYLPLCDGHGRQVTFGIAEELLHLSIRYGPGRVPNWRVAAGGEETQRYRVPFSPASFALALDEALAEAGVEVLFDTLVCLPVMDGNRVAGLEVENKSGRGVLHARCVIDATGDADVAFRAGAECFESENWLAIWALQASLKSAGAAADRADGTPLLNRIRVGGGGDQGLAPPEGGFRGTNGDDVSRFVREGRRLLREHFRRKQAEVRGGREGIFPLALPTIAQFRTTRGIVGRKTLHAGEHGREAADSIGLVADWRAPGLVWEIPYGTLVPEKIEGLLAVGRCISSRDDAWHVTRVIPAAALTGQAAGCAAALAVRRDTTPGRLDVTDLQEVLRREGIPIHLADL